MSLPSFRCTFLFFYVPISDARQSRNIYGEFTGYQEQHRANNVIFLLLFMADSVVENTGRSKSTPFVLYRGFSQLHAHALHR